MTRTNAKISRYVDGDFCIDIIGGNKRGYYEAWICRADMSESVLLFGLVATSEREFVEIVEDNLPDYIKMYNDTFCGGVTA